MQILCKRAHKLPQIYYGYLPEARILRTTDLRYFYALKINFNTL